MPNKNWFSFFSPQIQKLNQMLRILGFGQFSFVPKKGKPIFKNILLLFQLENYNTKRFLSLVYSNLKIIFSDKRQELDYTKKMKLLILIWIVLIICLIILNLSFSKGFFILLNFILIILFSPVFLVLSNILISPIDIYLKKRIINKAREKILKSNILVIGITGSYGKTSQKEVLETVLKGKLRILKSEGNKNTPLGISDIILKNDFNNFDVFIVEMGAYKKGDIREICDLVSPKIGILTGITELHLERFGSLENIIDAKFELIESLGEDGFAIIDGSNENIKKGYSAKKDHFSVKKILEIKEIETLKYLPNFSGITFEYEGNNIQTKLLGGYSTKLIITAFEIARYFNFSTDEILESIKQIGYISHRLEPIYNPRSDLWIIDDSYNGNLEGVKAIDQLYSNIELKGRKVYLTPGLVELGEKSHEINKKVGEIISQTFELILLIKSKPSEYIKEGLLESGFNPDNIIFYDSATEAHNDLKNILKPGDSIVFQNDITDNYV